LEIEGMLGMEQMEEKQFSKPSLVTPSSPFPPAKKRLASGWNPAIAAAGLLTQAN
jgi:hypothetical protein